MSMKNSVLLHRTGRDQYGNKGQQPLNISRSSTESYEKTKAEHRLRSNEFVAKYSEEWLDLFTGKNLSSQP